MKHFEGDDAVVLAILRKVDRCHPTASQLAVDRIGTRERVAKLLNWKLQAMKNRVNALAGWKGYCMLTLSKLPGVILWSRSGGEVANAAEDTGSFPSALDSYSLSLLVRMFLSDVRRLLPRREGELPQFQLDAESSVVGG